MINDSTGRLTNDTSIRLKQFYVVPFPSIIGSNGDGSLTRPYSSLQQALDHIEQDYYYENMGSIHETTINLLSLVPFGSVPEKPEPIPSLLRDRLNCL